SPTDSPYSSFIIEKSSISISAIIDEISMVRADLMDAMDIFLRNVRKSDEPFGGIQMILIGDLYQLPPVITSQDSDIFYNEYGYTGTYFFDSEVFNRDDFYLEFVELEKVYRQEDMHFVNLLNSVRDNSINYNQIAELNKCKAKSEFYPDKDSGIISLCTTNKDVDAINIKNLSEIEEDAFLFESEIVGEVKQNLFPAENDLVLKIGAQVIFLNNDEERKWVNGTLGKIIDIVNINNEEEKTKILKIEVIKKIGSDEVKVIHEVKRHQWDISKYVMKQGVLEREQIGSFKQFPIKLAWAITIHKSQGKTFDKVFIDFGRGTFAHGQAYVALSRCRSFEGMQMKRLLRKSDIKMDLRVRDFFARFHYYLSDRKFSEKQKALLLNEKIKNSQTVMISYQKQNKIISVFKIQPYEIVTEQIEISGKNRDISVLEAYNFDNECDMKMSLRRILWIEE
ncbi:TPA: hypothetical protein EYP45_00940, partial [Candidatus Peregrinibacteria bacterium]|nr:hypothetical protein [Candidatus Peregrinibacteria bacterium]